MWIILGSVLLAVAIAAPLDVETTSAYKKTRSTSISPILTPMALYRSELIEAVGSTGASNGAILEFFIFVQHCYQLPTISDEEQFHHASEWATKWNIKWLKNTFRWDEASNSADIVHPHDSRPGRPKAISITLEEYNDIARTNTGLIRELLHGEDVSEQAIDEFLMNQLHLRSASDQQSKVKRIQLKNWRSKWDMDIEMFVDVIVTGLKEIQDRALTTSTGANAAEETTSSKGSNTSFKMMIILGSVVIAFALAAPVHENETPRWPQPPLSHILGTVGSLNYIGASNGALVEYFEIHRDPDSEEKYHKMLEWGKKWNIEFVKNLRYDPATNRFSSAAPDIDARDSNGNLVTKQVFPPKARTFTEEEFNAIAVRNEVLIRHLLEREGLHEQAIDEYFASGFHLRPVDAQKILRMARWCKRYVHGFHQKNEKAIFKFTKINSKIYFIIQLGALIMFADVVVTGAEEQPPVVESTAVPMETTTTA